MFLLLLVMARFVHFMKYSLKISLENANTVLHICLRRRSIYMHGFTGTGKGNAHHLQEVETKKKAIYLGNLKLSVYWHHGNSGKEDVGALLT
jgi:hypothetical protein